MFQRLVDFQHLRHALCHFIIELVFGEPRKEEAFARESPAWHTLSDARWDSRPGAAAYTHHHLLRTQETAGLQAQAPGSSILTLGNSLELFFTTERQLFR